MLYPLSYEGGGVFVLVRVLLLALRRLHASRSIMVRRGLAAAYADDAALCVQVAGLLLANEQRFSRLALVQCRRRSSGGDHDPIE
jgi:hypothetical protein